MLIILFSVHNREMFGLEKTTPFILLLLELDLKHHLRNVSCLARMRSWYSVILLGLCGTILKIFCVKVIPSPILLTEDSVEGNMLLKIGDWVVVVTQQSLRTAANLVAGKP